MALEKSLTLSSGVEANYWIVNDLQIYKNSETQIIVLLYLNAQAKQDGKHCVSRKIYDVSGQLWETYFSNTVLDTSNPFKSAYEYLKTLSDFENALDV